MFPHHGLPFGVWLVVVNPPFILNKEMFQKYSWIGSKRTQFACDMTNLVYFWWGVKSCGNRWSGKLWYAKFVEQNVLYSFTGDAYRISYVISIKPSVIHHHVVTMANVFLGGGCGSRSHPWVIFESLPTLNSAARVYTGDKAGTSSLNVATMTAGKSRD